MIKKATLQSFDSATYCATLQLQGSLSWWLHDVPVARNIPASEMVAGRNCAVLLFDPTNPSEAVVTAVWT